MSAYQGRPWETNVYLSLLTVPATAVTIADIVVRYRKFGASTFTVRTLSPADWVNVGDGFYVLRWPAVFVDTLGKFTYTIAGTVFDNFLYDEFEVDPVPLALNVAPELCVISGNIADIGGKPGVGQLVRAHLVSYPASAGTSVIAVDAVTTVPDYFGNFQIPLVQGKTVIIEIERTAIRYQLVVPAQSSANLLDLLPPLPG